MRIIQKSGPCRQLSNNKKIITLPVKKQLLNIDIELNELFISGSITEMYSKQLFFQLVGINEV